MGKKKYISPKASVIQMGPFMVNTGSVLPVDQDKNVSTQYYIDEDWETDYDF